MPVPKTAIDEHRCLLSPKHDIWLTRQVLRMQPVSKTQPVQ
jgi:hypothetical protein